jgi:hypothetical protein
LTASSSYTQDFPITVNAAPFVPVSNISGVPATATAGTPLTLSGTVEPSGATNQTITWSVASAGATGADISGNTLTTTAAGEVTVRATIANGLTASSSYTKDFPITVNPPPPGTLTITVGFNLGAITITGSDGINEIWQTGTSSSLQFSAEGYDDVGWVVDGGTRIISGNTLIINAMNYTTQPHSVTFIGTKKGTPYSQVIPFRVRY